MNLHAVTIIEVPPGTSIEQDGKIQIVTDTCAVFRKRSCYVTPKIYAALKEATND